MISPKMRNVRPALGWLAGWAMVYAGPALAQSGSIQGTAGLPVISADDPSTALSDYLRTLADSPRDLQALKGAGKAALDLGDGDAALSFFYRADEVAPNDGHVKAGIGSSLLLLEQAQNAMQFFDQATALGVPAAEIGGERGLAYDLLGDQKRAQLDYAMSLRRAEDPEVRRRLALSQAIGGDRAAALATIDAQLRRQDRAAWRVRAFVLALTGDANGATQAVRAVMPAQADMLEPFLARLPSLSPSDRALAVNFGHFPGAGPASQTLDGTNYAQSSGTKAAGVADERQLARAGLPVHASMPAQAPPPVQVAVPTRTAAPAPVRSANASPAPSRPGGVYGPPNSGAVSPRLTAGATAAPLRSAPPQSTSGAPAATSALAQPSEPAKPATVIPLPIEHAVQVPPPAPRSEKPAATRFADIAAAIAALPDGGDAESPQAAGSSAHARMTPIRSHAPATVADGAKSPSAAAGAKTRTGKGQTAKADAETDGKAGAKQVATASRKKDAAKKDAAKKEPAKPKEPSRVWVQVAGGANESSLPREFARLKAKAPKLFAGRSGWMTPLHATNRLLVGPFKTEDEAQEFINKLRKADLTGFSWTSPAGQAIAKLPAK
jgi:Flp pilus assembly protein TadD